MSVWKQTKSEGARSRVHVPLAWRPVPGFSSCMLGFAQLLLAPIILSAVWSVQTI